MLFGILFLFGFLPQSNISDSPSIVDEILDENENSLSKKESITLMSKA